MKKEDFLISIVIPIYEEGEQIGKNLHIIHKVLLENKINHEFFLVDDGSKDDTWQNIIKISSQIPSIRAVKFSRNFGKEAALFAGINEIKGDACIFMDADLQHPPSLIPQMVKLWYHEGYEVVECVKISRGKEKLFGKIKAKLFYHIMKVLTKYDLNGASDYKLLDRKVVDAMRQIKERETFFRGISAWVGFKRITLPFKVDERHGGTSKWSTSRLIKLSITAITSFSALPLQIVTLIGIIFLIGALLLGIHTLYMYFSNIAVSGFTTVILLLLIIGSFLMVSLGIIGIYLARIFEEVKCRPRYIISERLDANGKEKQSDEST